MQILFVTRNFRNVECNLYCDILHITVVPALGDPRRERPPAVYGHFVNVPTHFKVKLPLISGHISTKNRWRASKLATDSSLKFPCCRLVTNEQYITSSRVMNHVIAANQPLHWLRLFYDITSEKSCILFVQPAMSKNRTILSLYQRIEVLCRLGETHHVERLC